MAGLVIVCHCPDCPRKGQEMKQTDETHRHWLFRCPTCDNLRIVDKFRAGGTIGAGRREDQPAPQWIGKGF